MTKTVKLRKPNNEHIVNYYGVYCLLRTYGKLCPYHEDYHESGQCMDCWQYQAGYVPPRYPMPAIVYHVHFDTRYIGIWPEQMWMDGLTGLYPHD